MRLSVGMVVEGYVVDLDRPGAAGRVRRTGEGRRGQRARGVPVEVDLERTADMRLIVGMVVEGYVVDLDRPVVAGRVRRTGEGRRGYSARGKDQSGHSGQSETPAHNAPPRVRPGTPGRP